MLAWASMITHSLILFVIHESKFEKIIAVPSALIGSVCENTFLLKRVSYFFPRISIFKREVLNYIVVNS